MSHGAGQPAIVIVLGAAVWAGGVASPALARRARHAARLALARDGSLIITTGGVGRNPPAEGEVAAEICHSLGVPRDRIRAETTSTTTYENLAFAQRLIPAGSTAPVIIVTDYTHLPRALLTARHLGLRATGAFPREGLAATPLRRHLWQIGRECLALPVYALRLAWLSCKR